MARERLVGPPLGAALGAYGAVVGVAWTLGIARAPTWQLWLFALLCATVGVSIAVLVAQATRPRDAPPAPPSAPKRPRVDLRGTLAPRSPAAAVTPELARLGAIGARKRTRAVLTSGLCEWKRQRRVRAAGRAARAAACAERGGRRRAARAFLSWRAIALRANRPSSDEVQRLQGAQRALAVSTDELVAARDELAAEAHAAAHREATLEHHTHDIASVELTAATELADVKRRASEALVEASEIALATMREALAEQSMLHQGAIVHAEAERDATVEAMQQHARRFDERSARVATEVIEQLEAERSTLTAKYELQAEAASASAAARHAALEETAANAANELKAARQMQGLAVVRHWVARASSELHVAKRGAFARWALASNFAHAAAAAEAAAAARHAALEEAAASAAGRAEGELKAVRQRRGLAVVRHWVVRATRALDDAKRSAFARWALASDYERAAASAETAAAARHAALEEAMASAEERLKDARQKRGLAAVRGWYTRAANHQHATTRSAFSRWALSAEYDCTAEAAAVAAAAQRALLADEYAAAEAKLGARHAALEAEVAAAEAKLAAARQKRGLAVVRRWYVQATSHQTATTHSAFARWSILTRGSGAWDRAAAERDRELSEARAAFERSAEAGKKLAQVLKDTADGYASALSERESAHTAALATERERTAAALAQLQKQLAAIKSDHAEQLDATLEETVEVTKELAAHKHELAEVARLHATTLDAHALTKERHARVVGDLSAALRAEHAAELEKQGLAHAAIRDSHAEALSELSTTLHSKHAAELDDHNAAHAAALDELTASLRDELSAAVKAQQLGHAELNIRHKEAQRVLASTLRAEHAVELQSVEDKHRDSASTLRAQLETVRDEHHSASTTLRSELRAARSTHLDELEAHRDEHRSVASTLRAEHAAELAATLDRHSAVHASKASDFKQQLDATLEETIEVTKALAAHKRELAEAARRHSAALEDHAATKKCHAKALEALSSERVAALGEHAAAKECHAEVLEALASEHGDALEAALQQRESFSLAAANEACRCSALAQSAARRQSDAATNAASSAVSCVRLTAALEAASASKDAALQLRTAFVAHRESLLQIKLAATVRFARRALKQSAFRELQSFAALRNRLERANELVGRCGRKLTERSMHRTLSEWFDVVQTRQSQRRIVARFRTKFEGALLERSFDVWTRFSTHRAHEREANGWVGEMLADTIKRATKTKLHDGHHLELTGVCTCTKTDEDGTPMKQDFRGILHSAAAFRRLREHWNIPGDDFARSFASGMSGAFEGGGRTDIKLRTFDGRFVATTIDDEQLQSLRDLVHHHYAEYMTEHVDSLLCRIYAIVTVSSLEQAPERKTRRTRGARRGSAVAKETFHVKETFHFAVTRSATAYRIPSHVDGRNYPVAPATVFLLKGATKDRLVDEATLVRHGNRLYRAAGEARPDPRDAIARAALFMPLLDCNLAEGGVVPDAAKGAFPIVLPKCVFSLSLVLSLSARARALSLSLSLSFSFSFFFSPCLAVRREAFHRDGLLIRMCLSFPSAQLASTKSLRRTWHSLPSMA